MRKSSNAVGNTPRLTVPFVQAFNQILEAARLEHGANIMMSLREASHQNDKDAIAIIEGIIEAAFYLSHGRKLGKEGEGEEGEPQSLTRAKEALALWVRHRAHIQDVPTTVEPSVTRSEVYPVHTSEEWIALLQAAADGQYGQGYQDDETTLTRTHQRGNVPYETRLTLLPEEREAGHGVDLLRRLTDRLDIDAAFALLYISHCLAPRTGALPANTYAGGWIDLNDVATKIGLRADTAAQAEHNRSLIWDYIRYGARASIVGKRSIPYYDPRTHKEIDTQISTAPWAILTRQQPVQPNLFELGNDETAPVRVELVASREWTQLTMSAATAQFLPLGEILGAIPGKRAAGAWARSIGLAFVYYCRKRPQDACDGDLRPTREQLLSLYPAKVTPYTEFVTGASKNPRRLVLYWKDALGILVDSGILAPEGEAIRQEADLMAAYAGQYNWTSAWLKETVDLRPGPKLRPSVDKRAGSLPAPGNRSLPRRPGRPRNTRQGKIIP